MTEEVPEKRRFIEYSCFFTNKVDDPFSDLSINDSDFLDDVPEREVCPKCNRSRRFYCYSCYIPVPGIMSKTPSVRLPVKIDIIKHPKEVDGKSTSAHVAVLAPADVTVYTYPDFPTYSKEKVLLIFPGKSAMTMKEVLNPTYHGKNSLVVNNQKQERCPCTNIEDNTHPRTPSDSLRQCEADSVSSFPYDRIIFIDSTWRQSKKLYADPIIKSLPCCVLTSHKSLFWRHQRDKPENHLATVEAVYYFLVELHQSMYPGVPYCGRYDNLLFFFKFMYYKIRTLYDPATLKAYQT